MFKRTQDHQKRSSQLNPIFTVFIFALSAVFYFNLSAYAKVAPTIAAVQVFPPPDVTAAYSVNAIAGMEVKHAEVSLTAQTVTTRTVEVIPAAREIDSVNVPGVSFVGYIRQVFTPAFSATARINRIPIGGGNMTSLDFSIVYKNSAGGQDWVGAGFSLQADSKHNVYAFVSGWRISTGNDELYVFISRDQGVTWSRTLLLNNNSVKFRPILEARIDEVNNQYHIASFGSVRNTGGGVVSLVFNSITNAPLSTSLAYQNTGICNNYLNFGGNAARSYIGVPGAASCQGLLTTTRAALGVWSNPQNVLSPIVYADELVRSPNPMFIFLTTVKQPINSWEGRVIGLEFSVDSGQSFRPLPNVTNDPTQSYSYASIAATNINSLAVGYVVGQRQVKIRHSIPAGWVETHVDTMSGNIQQLDVEDTK